MSIQLAQVDAPGLLELACSIGCLCGKACNLLPGVLLGDIQGVAP